MAALGQLGIVLCVAVGIGILAARCERDERFFKRVAAVFVLVLMLSLASAIVRGDLLRFAPGAQDIEAESGGSFR